MLTEVVSRSVRIASGVLHGLGSWAEWSHFNTYLFSIVQQGNKLLFRASLKVQGKKH